MVMSMTKICTYAYALNIVLALLNIIQGIVHTSHEFMLMALFNIVCARIVTVGIKDKDSL